MKNMAYFAQAYPKELWFLDNYSHSPFIPGEITGTEIPAMTECILLVRRGTEQGVIRQIDPMMCTQMVSGMLLSAVQGALLGKYHMD